MTVSRIELWLNAEGEIIQVNLTYYDEHHQKLSTLVETLSSTNRLSATIEYALNNARAAITEALTPFH